MKKTVQMEKETETQYSKTETTRTKADMDNWIFKTIV
jgi:hypothetical protein